MASKSKSKVARNVSSESLSPAGGKRSNARASLAITSKDGERFSLAYKVLSAQQTQKLMEASDVSELEHMVKDVLNIKDTRLDLKAAAILDFHVGALWWCKEQSYSSEQTSALYTVVDTLLNNIDKKQMSVADNLLCLKNMLAGVGCVDHFESEGSEMGGLQGVFDVAQAKNIVAYLDVCVFQHYKLYELLFSSYQPEHVTGLNLPMDTAPKVDIPWPSPLCEAIPVDVHQQHFAEKPANGEEINADGVEDAEVNDASADAEEEIGPTEPSEEDLQHEADILSKLTPEQIEQVVEEVCAEVLDSLEEDVAASLRKRENELIARINKMNVVKRT